MKSTRWHEVRRFSGLALAVLVILSLGFAAGQFSPPRTAVVSISTVFESYEKKKDKQSQLQERMDVLKQKLEDLERDYNQIQAELKQLKQDSPLYMQKSLERFELEQRVTQLRNTELKELRQTQIKFLREIRDEITAEIEAYATAHHIELVLEREVTAESEAAGAGFRWPIVHFAKPELDISGEIAGLLNERYRKKR